MRTDDFWAVIDRATADRPASPGEVAKRATADLAARDPEEIVAWARHLDKVMVASGTQDLWAAAYLINGGCSDEGFDSFRGWLIAHGREAVARSVKSPDSLADLPAVRAAADSGAVAVWPNSALPGERAWAAPQSGRAGGRGADGGPAGQGRGGADSGAGAGESRGAGR